MHIDVHQLDVFVLWGSAVTFLAILAVRVSSRTRLPSPAALPAHGRRARRGRARHRLRGRRARARAGVRGAGRDPGRGWSDHHLAGDPTVDAARPLAGHGRGRASASRSSRVGAHYLLGLSWETRGAARRGHLADRRRCGVLGAPGGAAPAAAHRRARGGVRASTTRRRSSWSRSSRPGAARRARRALATPGSSSTSWSPAWPSGWSSASAGAWVMRRAALPSSGLYPLAVLSLCFLAYGSRGRRARVRLRRGLRRRADPRQRRAAAPGGHPVLRRGRWPGWPRSGCS